MNGSSKNDPDVAALRDDLAALKRDVTNLIEHLKTGATNTAHGAAAQLDDGAQRLYRNVVAEGERSVKAMSRQVEEQPLTAMLVALGIGYVAGRLLTR
jgi:ElaB/YqjD/DUF883 family membrane-anchored ribosome-binding protein